MVTSRAAAVTENCLKNCPALGLVSPERMLQYTELAVLSLTVRLCLLTRMKSYVDDLKRTRLFLKPSSSVSDSRLRRTLAHGSRYLRPETSVLPGILECIIVVVNIICGVSMKSRPSGSLGVSPLMAVEVAAEMCQSVRALIDGFHEVKSRAG